MRIFVRDRVSVGGGYITPLMFPEQVPMPNRFNAENSNYFVENFRFAVEMWIASRLSSQNLGKKGCRSKRKFDLSISFKTTWEFLDSILSFVNW